MSNYVVISFYTQDWEYPSYALKLAADCQRLDIDHVIKELPSDGDYVKNCNKKPRFIYSCLKELKKPVLWIDVDASILSRPKILDQDDMLDHDIAVNIAEWDDKKIHVGSLWFNCTEPTLNLIRDWNDQSERSSWDDDISFNQVIKSHQDNLKFRILPREYFVILRSVNDVAPSGTHIVHRLSTGSSKESYKKRLAETYHAG